MLNRGVAVLAMIVLMGLLAFGRANAMEFSSSNFVIDAGALNNVGGASGSTNYQLESSGGQAAIGNGASGSYKLAAGYVAQIIKPEISLTTQPLGLTNYYTLDENSGTVVHDSSNNPSLGEFVGTPSWTSGQLGSALNFSATAVTFNDSAIGAFSQGTVEVWVKTTNTSGTRTAVGKHGAWTIELVNGVPTVCGGASSVADGNWHHLTAVFDAGVTNGSELFVDGLSVGKCTWSPSDQAGLLTIGQRRVGTSTYDLEFVGAIDHVKLFDRKLSAQEIKAEYDAQSVGAPTGLTLQTVLAGASNDSDFEIITLTSGSSYQIALEQNNDLKSGSYTIPALSSAIGSPSTWNEGTTKGLGFSVVSSTATPIDGKWSSGGKFAALPLSATSVYQRTGVQATDKDVLRMRLKLDVAKSQPSGEYKNIMTVTGTALP